MDVVSQLFRVFTDVVIYFLDIAATIVIVIRGGHAFICFIRPRCHDSSSVIRLRFARGLALALEFQLAAEILHTIKVKTLSELAVIAMIIVLRILITLIVHWEMDHEVRYQKESDGRSRLNEDCSGLLE